MCVLCVCVCKKAQSDAGRFMAQNPASAACTLDQLERAVAEAKAGNKQSYHALAKGLHRTSDQNTNQPGYWRNLQRMAEAGSERVLRRRRSRN